VVFDTLTKELEGYLVELREAWRTLLPPVDDFLKARGKPPIEVAPRDRSPVRRPAAMD
jgi:hypothetical protein